MPSYIYLMEIEQHGCSQLVHDFTLILQVIKCEGAQLYYPATNVSSYRSTFAARSPTALMAQWCQMQQLSC